MAASAFALRPAIAAAGQPAILASSAQAPACPHLAELPCQLHRPCPRFLPASKINGAAIDHAVISDGCIITRCQIGHCVIGVRSIVEEGSRLHRVVVMGNDYYETEASILSHEAQGQPRIGIGKNTRIENAIVDKNARIGSNCVISPAGKPDTVDHPLYYIRDGVVIIPKNGIVPDNTVI